MNTDLELVKQPTAPAVSSRDPESILRYAIDHNADVNVIERMMVVRDKLRAEAAKEGFDSAMAEFQGECPIILKRKAGAKNAYRYAPLDDIVRQVRDLLKKFGFSFKITTQIEAGWVEAFCTITHKTANIPGGPSETSGFKVPVDTKNPMMTEPQRYGGALTFAKRYAFCNAFGILTADEDLDGGAKPKPAGPAEATPKVRARMLELFADIKEQAHAYAIDRGWIMPNEGLETWPLDRVPVTKADLEKLRKEVVAHK